MLQSTQRTGRKTNFQKVIKEVSTLWKTCHSYAMPLPKKRDDHLGLEKKILFLADVLISAFN